jgi:hypothetical protein
MVALVRRSRFQCDWAVRRRSPERCYRVQTAFSAANPSAGLRVGGALRRRPSRSAGTRGGCRAKPAGCERAWIGGLERRERGQAVKPGRDRPAMGAHRARRAFEGGPGGCQGAAMASWWVCGFSRLCVAVINRHSDRTAERPRRWKRSMPRLNLVLPKTGSIMPLRLR